MPPGSSAAWKISWVLMTRSLRPVVVTAIVCADSMASLSRISTSDGGTSTPSVLATATSAWRLAAGMPSAASRGATTRDRPSTLAPTEPFIGPSNAPSSMPDTSGAAGLRGRMALEVR